MDKKNEKLLLNNLKCSINIRFEFGQCILSFEGILPIEKSNIEADKLSKLIEKKFPFNWNNLIPCFGSRNKNKFSVSYKFDLYELRSDFNRTIPVSSPPR